MGKAARSRRHDKKKAEKAKRKAAQRAKYAAFRDAGQNKKSKRNRRTSLTSRKVRTTVHPADCGNIACSKCYPGWWNNGDPEAPGYRRKAA